MKKLSLLSLLGLLAFVAMPIYAQDVYFDENYIVVPEDLSTENLAEEDVVVNDEIDYGVYEDGVALETVEEDGVVLAVEEEQAVENVADGELPELDLLNLGELTQYPYQERSSSNLIMPSSNANRLIGFLAGGLGLLGMLIAYCIIAYFFLFPVSIWEIYRKAGKKGWSFVVPFWGTMTYSEVAGMNKWLGLLPWLGTIWAFFQGFVSSGTYSTVLMVLGVIALLWLIVANYRTARRYGWNVFASILHAIIILCPITVLVLGLGNYKYQGQAKKEPETIVEA